MNRRKAKWSKPGRREPGLAFSKVSLYGRLRCIMMGDGGGVWREAGRGSNGPRCEPLLGLEELRVDLFRKLGLPLDDGRPLGNLVEEVAQRQDAFLERLKSSGYQLASQQSPQVEEVFLTGVGEGFGGFLDAKGSFAGDRGRTEIYMRLLELWAEIEEMRRSDPPKTRHDPYVWLISPEVGVKIPTEEWFNDVCDSIGLSMKGPGRPRSREKR